MYTYSLTLDESYFRALIARYYQQRSFLFKPEWQAAIAGAVLLAALLFVPVDGNRATFVFLMALLYAVAALGGVAAIRVLVYQKFRYTSYFGRDSTTTLTDEGVKVGMSSGSSLTAWSKYHSAVRYPDGIMLLRRGVIWWLPDRSLAAGTAQDVVQFVSKRTRMRNVA